MEARSLPCVLVAEGAAQCEIAEGGPATVLAGDDVIHFMWDERQSFRHQAIFASANSPGADFRAQGGTDLRHYWEA